MFLIDMWKWFHYTYIYAPKRMKEIQQYRKGRVRRRHMKAKDMDTWNRYLRLNKKIKNRYTIDKKTSRNDALARKIRKDIKDLNCVWDSDLYNYKKTKLWRK